MHRHYDSIFENILATLFLLLYPLQSYIRTIIAPRRMLSHRYKNIFIKLCASPEKARKEFNLMSKIITLKPRFFIVPKPISIMSRKDKTYLLTKYIKARDIMWYTEHFLQSKDYKLLSIFYMIGQGLRELHEINIKLQNEYTFSEVELYKMMKKAVIELCSHKFLTLSQSRSIMKLMKKFMENKNINFFLEPVNLHGAPFPSNVLVSEGSSPFFVDFDTMFRGPRFIDLMNILGSIYSSIFISPNSLKQVNLIIKKFVRGYNGEIFNDDMYKSLILLYMLSVGRSYLNARYQTKSLRLKVIAFIILKNLERKIKCFLSYIEQGHNG